VHPIRGRERLKSPRRNLLTGVGAADQKYLKGHVKGILRRFV
jgi:hypothetical protein